MKTSDKNHLLDVNSINAAFEEGSLIALPIDYDPNTLFGVTMYSKLSHPLVDKETGIAKYMLGYFYDNDEWKYTKYMTIQELRDHVYFYEMKPEILG